MSVNVTDATLDLDGVGNNNEHIFSNYQSHYISADNYYGDVHVQISNSNVSITKEILDNGKIAFLIAPQKNGETILTFTDNEPGGVNTKSVKVVIGGSGSGDGGGGNGGGDNGGEEVSSSEKIRYIRDHLNASSINEGSHWVEIQALDSKEENLALGKSIQGSSPQRYPNYPYTRITDGNIDTGVYTESKSSASHVTVDLGSLYEIERVKVWHYYGDSRTYYGTKTEVSSDGQNWVILFDSAIDGTYTESSSGRSYQVNITGGSEGNSGDEFDKILEEIFSTIGAGEINISNTEVPKLKDSSKAKIDTIINKIITNEGKEYTLSLQSSIPKFREKYKSIQQQIILDYISVSIDKYLGVKIIHSIENISLGEVGGLEFEVSSNLQGKISNIGVEFINESGVKDRKELKIQSDRKYIVAFSEDSCKGCKDLKPYYLLSGNTDIIIADAQMGNIEISNSSYDIFKNILKQVWFWKGYSKQGMKNAIVDIKEDIVKGGKNISIYIILQSIAKTTSIEVDIGVYNIDTLPIAGYMLDKFLNEENPYYGHDLVNVTDKDDKYQDAIYYKGSIDIVKKFKDSMDYKNILGLLEGRCNYELYNNYLTLSNGETTICVKKDGSNFNVKQELDLYMAVNGYFYSIEIFKENDILYSKVRFWDEYDFEPNTYGTSVSDTLNYWGNYYEKELSGENYWWLVEITDKLGD